MRRLVLLVSALFALGLSACGGSSGGTADTGTSSGKSDGGTDPSHETCASGTAKSCTDDMNALVCNVDGTGYETAPCPSGTFCDLNQCVSMVCTPGVTSCKDTTTAATCDARGSAYASTTPCNTANGESCINGQCLTECDLAKKNASYIGCEYYAVHLDNADGSGSTAGASSQPMTLVASNTSDREASFTVYNQAGTALSNCTNVKVPAKGVGTCDVKDLVRASGVSGKAYRLVSTRPVTVYQFNPLNNVDVYSNDASLLLPSHVAAQQYFVTSWPQIYQGQQPGQFVVIAASPGTTSVKITVTAPVGSGTGFTAMSAGESRTVSLQQGQVLSVESNGDGADLTGSFVDADKPVVVFGAHRCANVPSGVGGGTPASYCDHLEEQLFPIATWGKSFVASRTADRPSSGTNVPDFYRVIASTDGTTITTNPAIAGANGSSLKKGQVLQFSTAQDFELTASSPVSMSQYMPGSTYQNPNASSVHIGDPSMIMVPPSEQFRSSYVVLTPHGYKSNFINVVQPSGANPTIDGKAVDAATCAAAGSGTYKACRVPVGEGAHVISASKGVGVIMYGFDQDVSYGYVGGLDLKKIASGWK